jgi:hypothetical protein
MSLCAEREPENHPRRFPGHFSRWLSASHSIHLFSSLVRILFRVERERERERETEREECGDDDKPSTQCPLMENGKATQRKMKAETTSDLQETPGILQDTNGMPVRLVDCPSLTFSGRKDQKLMNDICMMSVCPGLIPCLRKFSKNIDNILYLESEIVN